MRFSLSLALLLAVLHAGCRTADPNPVPTVPSDATTLIVADDEMPRVLYAEAWGAFAQFGWTFVDHDSDALRFTVRPPDAAEDAASAVLHLMVEPGDDRATASRIVARVEPDAPGARAVLLSAAHALATLPGTLSSR